MRLSIFCFKDPQKRYNRGGACNDHPLHAACAGSSYDPTEARYRVNGFRICQGAR